MIFFLLTIENIPLRADELLFYAILFGSVLYFLEFSLTFILYSSNYTSSTAHCIFVKHSIKNHSFMSTLLVKFEFAQHYTQLLQICIQL